MEREFEAAPLPVVETPTVPDRTAVPVVEHGLMTPAAVLRLQRSAGNAAVTRLIARDVAITGEPTDVTPTKKETGTVNALPQMADTAGPLDREDAGPTQRIFPATQMKPKATAERPFVTNSSTFPGWDALVEQHPAGDPAAAGFVTVTEANQEAPELKMTDGLYIGGSPKADDVQQGMVGDCWSLAVVAAIAGRDPGKIMATITVAGTGATATFFRRKTEVEWGLPPKLKTVYEPVHVTTSGDLPFTVDEAGRSTAKVNGVRQIHGAALRHGAHAIDKRWWVEMAGGKAVVHSKATYEVARWSPLLEKAYAMFAAKYGQYGGTGANDEKKGGDGYAAIEGGFEQDLYAVFYGEQGDNTRHPENVPNVETAFSPGTNVLVNNVGIIKQLLPLQGRPDQAGLKDPGSVPLVTAATSNELMFKRLAETIDFLVGFDEYEKLINRWTRSRIDILRKKLKERADLFFPGTSKGAKLLGTEAKTMHEIATAARLVVENHNGDDLYAARSDPRMGTAARNVADLVLDVMNAGTDNSPGQRNLYGEHAYTVMSCKFADAAGAPVVLPPSLPADKTELTKTLAPVAQEQSTVRLFNPHHANEPDERGDGKPARAESGAGDDGLFTINLTQFMLNMSNVSSFVPAAQLMSRVELRTGSDVDALALADAYARLLAAGDDGELVVRIGEPPARIDLVPDGSPWYEVPFAVTIEADPPALMPAMPIRVAGRRVRLAGLALPFLLGGGLQVAAAEGIALDTCALVKRPERRPAAAAVLRVSGAAATCEVTLRDCVLRAGDPDADAPVVRVETPGPTPVYVQLDGCDLGAGLQVVADGALGLVVRGSRCPDPPSALRCAPGNLDVGRPADGAPAGTLALATLLG